MFGAASSRNRPKKLGLVQEQVHGRRQWKLVGYYINGRRVRKFFPRKVDGERFIEDLEEKQASLGQRAGEVSGWLHEQALKAEAILAPFSVSLVEVAEYFVKAQQERLQSIPVSELAAKYLNSRKAKGGGEAYLRDIKSRTSRFVNDFGEFLAGDLTTRQVDTWISSLGLAPVTSNNFRTVLHGMFSFGKKQGYVTVSPVSEVEKVKVVSKPPGILSVEELRVILETADLEVQCVIAIGAFAGLRQAELERLDWSKIRLDRKIIDLSASSTKTAQRRLVSISDNLAVWLERGYKAAGKVVPTNYRKRFLKAAEAGGFKNTMAPPAERKLQKGKKDWPNNALRHSFASYHLALGKDAAKTAHEMGHATTDILYQHYRELVVEEEAQKYWDMVPTKVF